MSSVSPEKWAGGCGRLNKMQTLVGGLVMKELQEGIKRVLDREGILFLGSGFSIGGKNRNGENMKVGADLSYALCRDLGVKESADLAITSQRYIEDPKCKKSLIELIAFLKNEVFCAEATENQNIIASLPWNRIYTTNYDNSFEIASEYNNIKRKTITITNERYSAGRQLNQAIIHINGSILNLDEKSFYDEFKITDENYTREGLLQSSWKNMFDSDLQSTRAIFFIGYSLQYDQELVRHIANLNVKDKCFFIDVDFDDEDKAYKISRYGKLEKIGTDGFAKEIASVKKTYEPRVASRKMQGFIKRESTDYYSEIQYSSADEIKLLISGTLTKGFINQEGYCISRNKITCEIKELLLNKDIVVVQSRLGNGKSILLECLSFSCIENYNVFFVNSLSNMIEDLNILQTYTDKVNLILIDDYGYYLPLIKEFRGTIPQNVKLVMTCRSSININLYSDLHDRYQLEKDKIGLIDIDEMYDEDIREAIKILNINRLWGKFDCENNTKKKKLIVDRYGNQISKLFYLLLDSETIKSEIGKLIEAIILKSGLYDFVLAQSINTICNLKFSYSDIRSYLNLSNSVLRSYAVDKDVRELINIADNDLMLSSSIFAQYIVRESKMKKEIIEILKKIYCGCSQNDDTFGKYYQQRRNMVNRSNIMLLVNGDGGDRASKEDEEKILEYFDSIKNLPTASQNPFFWLQFGITALNLEFYTQASIYFENAYSNASRMSDFDTFQIDTHRARLLLFKEMADNSNNPVTALKTFHEVNFLLINNGNKGARNTYVFRQVGEYYKYYNYYINIFTEEQKNDFISNALKISDKFRMYFYELDGKIALEVVNSYKNYRKIFEKTPYILLLKEIDGLFNSKVEKRVLQIKY